MMKYICLIKILLFVLLSSYTYAQGTNSNWQPPPYPQWFNNLSKIEQQALIEIATSSWITYIALSPSNVRIETRKIVDKYGVAWAYAEDDKNIFSVIVHVDGQFYQVVISLYWLNNLR